jgi:putative DNA primase/helicase
MSAQWTNRKTGEHISAPLHHADGSHLTSDELRDVEAAAPGELIGETDLRAAYRESLEASEDTQQPCFTMYDHIKNKPVQWLWPGKIPLGMFSMLVGSPKSGKSFISCDLMARVTTGAFLPDKTGRAPLGAVVSMTSEDSPECTMGPRLDACGALRKAISNFRGAKITESADSKKVNSIVAFNPIERLQSLEKMIRLLEARFDQVPLMVIDPITAFLGDTNQSCTEEVRAALSRLALIAELHNMAVLGISHFNKSQTFSAMTGILGSTAFAAQARSILMVEREIKTGQRCFVIDACNMAPIPEDSGLEYDIESVEVDVGISGRVKWGKPTSLTADALRQSAIEGRGRPPKARDKAVAWLEGLLVGGPMRPRDVLIAAEKAAMPRVTVFRAVKHANISISKGEKGLLWSLT